MNESGLLSRLGPRTNTGAANNASWILAVGILAVVIPASEKVAANRVFFAAHQVSPLAWVALLVAGLVICWLFLAGILHLVRRRGSARTFDLVASVLMLLVTWFFVGNILSRTVLAGAPVLGPVIGLVAAAAITLLARRLAMGTILVVFAGVAAVVPLVLSVVNDAPTDSSDSLAFDASSSRPSILWIVSDELQYPLVMDQGGQVRDEFPNLKALQQDATTYTKAYSAANYTDYAVPSMLSGISDVAAQGPERMQKVRAGLGIVPGLSSEYAVVMESPIYSFDCQSEACASVGSGEDVGVVQRYWDFAKDTAAIAGRTALAAPFSNAFPSLDGKWRDFWSGGDEFGDGAEGNSVQSVIDGIGQASAAGQPVFSFWHTIRTHAPWVVDRQGRQMYPARVPVVEGAHMIGAEADQTYTTEELKRLERRLYAASAIDFDRQLGQLIEELKATGQYDDLMIVLTADHGATMTERSDRRVGDTLVQRWSEVAHVPLLVKQPGQAAPEVVTAPRSTGQIAATVLASAGATADPSLALSPDLGQDLPDGPVFTTVAGGVLTPWRYEGVDEVDPWLPEDLTPVDERYPFAVGLAADQLGAAVPADAVAVRPTRVQVLSGESDQQVLVVDRPSEACSPEATVGLVSVDGSVVGSVLWEGLRGASGDQTRGWAIVPVTDPATYSYWCAAG